MVPLRLAKYAYLAWFGGSTYVTVEVFYREYSHWTMFLVGALCFICIGALNNILSWDLGFIWQVILGVSIVTALEFTTGCIVNLGLGWHIWDYSNLPGNIFGQICPQFILAWIPLIIIAIITDDVIRWKFFGEMKPQYHLL